MVMTVYGQEIPCQRAEKGSDFVRAYDEGGACVFEAAKIADFSGYSLTGGAWSAAEPTGRRGASGSWRRWWRSCCSEVRANDLGAEAAVPRGAAAG